MAAGDRHEDARQPEDPGMVGVAIACGLLVAAMAMGRAVIENDVFWHLAIGRHVLEHGFPLTDPFGIGTEGLPWSPPEWLSEIAMFVLHDHGGWGALAVAHLVVVTGIGALVALRARTLGAPPAHLLLACALLSIPAALHLPMRPLIVGHLFSALVLWVLALDRQRARRRTALLPLVFVLWANLHPSWPLGLGWIVLEVVLRALSGPLSERFPARVAPAKVSRGLLVALALSPLAVLLRPDGLDGALYPFVHVIGLGDQMREIIEWFPLSPTRPLHAMALISGGLTLVLAARARRIDVVELGIALVSLVLMVRYQRFAPLALIGWAPLLASALPEVASTERLRALLSTERGGAIAAGAMAVLAAIAFPAPAMLADSVEIGFPVAATDALVRIDAQRERDGEAPLAVFTTFEDGGYVLWRRERGRVYLDSRFDLYARAGVFREYLALRAGGSALPIFEARDMNAAIVPTTARDDHFDPLRRELSDHGFEQRFSDEQAVLLIRSD